MKNILNSIEVFLLLLLISKPGHAQDYNFYPASDAVMLQVNGDIRIESRLKKTIIVLSNNSNQLNLRINIPYHLINYVPEDNTMLPAPGLSFDLKMTINPWKIQDELTSTKVFISQGLVTMNHITKAVKVEYIPLPAGPDQDGNFNLSMIIQFYAGDFNLDTPGSNSQFIIKISEATVNRI
jgi:hypothetical protein